LNNARHSFMAAGEPPGRKGKLAPASTLPKSQQEDLPYKIELWDETKQSVEQTLAVTASGSIGYAAFYAATKEFALRYITLRHKSAFINRWNPPSH
jgi:hypothetical protein